MNLFTPVTLGLLSLENRILMAPLTRMRAGDDGVPGPLAAEYYAQRASAGLIISEATQISPLGKGYPATPGIYSDSQVAAWRTVTDAVHARGGKIVLQLWHVGRISHSSLHPDEGLPVAPSAIQPAGKVYTASWSLAEYETPRALTLEEIGQLKADYVHAAHQAKAAGFDGVELHAANGYLLDQFLQDRTNQRTDAYGGSIANRCKLVLEILEAIIPVWGSGRVGIRLSPYGTFNDIADSDPKALFAHLINALNRFNLSYLHLIEPRATTAGGSDQLVADAPRTGQLFRSLFTGKVVLAGGFDQASAEKAIADGEADAIAFGRLFIANPDLPKRFELKAPLNPYQRATFYGGNEKGYTDYPAL
ncbi:alkene reductase [Polynucleobacter sp. HIN7]|uniref:alkene reductase n=1 Tax=Polynucleobacter sp. HIN7 TaxID=3047866 RepID=UPI002573C040|nr:alkene reductase [Polynucleobacter sp. HIN7]BEI37838.1 alkene reductase [Polynucleobacter sp. HIN7]